MAEINEDDLISKSALEAPGKLADQLDRVVVSIEKILSSAKKSESTIISSKSTSKVTTETDNLVKSQRKLAQEQEKAAKIAKVLWLSENEVAESQKRASKEGKNFGTIVSELDKKMAAAANSATAYSNAQKQSNKESTTAVATYKAEAGSLQDLTTRRTNLQNSVKSYRKDQEEDNRLLRTGIINRAEFNKRIADSDAAISKSKLGIQQLNYAIKNHILTNTKLGGEYKKLTIQLEQARVKYKDLAASGTASTQALRSQLQVFESLNKKVTTIDKSVGQFQRNVGNYPRIFGAATQSLTSFLSAFGIVTGIALFARMIKEVIGLNVEFEHSNSRLAAILGKTKSEISDLREQQIKLGETTLFTANQYATLQIELAKLGFPTDDIDDMTESTANAAIAMGSELAPQAELTGSTLRAYGLEAKDVNMVNDQLSKSTTLTALDFEKLGTALPYVGASAHRLGFNLRDTLALMGRLANTGLRATTIGTSLRSIFLKLADSGSELSKRFKEPVRDLPSLLKGLKDLRDRGVDLGEALELTDVRSVTAFSSLIDGADAVEKVSEALDDATGFTKELADTVTDNLRGDFILLTSAAQGLSREIGESLDGALRKIVRGVTSFLLALKEIPSFLRENRGLILALAIALIGFNVAAIKAAGSAILFELNLKRMVIAEKVANLSTKALWATLAANPIGLVIVALGALVAAVSLYDRYSARANKVSEERNSLFKGIANQTENVTKAQKSLNYTTEEWLKMSESQKRAAAEQIEFTINHTKAMLTRLKVQKIQLEESAKELTLWQKIKVNALGAFSVWLGADARNAVMAIKEQQYGSENAAEATEGYEDAVKKLEDEIDGLTHLLDDNTRAQKEHQEQLSEEEKKRLIEAKKAQLELDKFRLEQQLKTLQKIQDNENNALETRLAASRSAEKVRRDIALVENQYEKLGKIKGAAELVKIDEEYQAKLSESAENGANDRNEINRKALEKQIKDAEDAAKLITERILFEEKLRADGSIAIIQNEVIAGNRTRKSAEIEIAKIKKKSGQNLLRISIDSIKEQLEVERTEYYDKRKDLIENSNLNAADKGAALVELEKQYAQEKLDAEQKLHDARVKLQDSRYEMEEINITDNLDQIKTAYDDLSQAIGDIFDSLTDRRVANIDREQRALEDQVKSDLELAGDNENAKKRIEDRAEERRKQLEKSRIEAARKQAKFEKAQAIISAGIQGGLVILNALKTEPFIPAGLAAAVLAGVLTAAQITAIAAKPLPSYEHGTEFHPGGPARVSESGFEGVVHQGRLFYTPQEETVVDLPRASKVIPHDDMMKRLAMDGFAHSMLGESKSYEYEMLTELQGINKNISKPRPSESIISNGHRLYRVIQKGDTYKNIIRQFNMGKWV